MSTMAKHGCVRCVRRVQDQVNDIRKSSQKEIEKLQKAAMHKIVTPNSQFHSVAFQLIVYFVPPQYMYIQYKPTRHQTPADDER